MILGMRLTLGCTLALAFVALGGCDDADPKSQMMSLASSPSSAGASAADIAELEMTGVAKYIGAAKPALTQPAEAGVTVYTFAIEDGPRCLRGAPYSMGTRDQDSENLLIYLQGGGSCSSAICQATTTASTEVPATGIMNPTDPGNPVASWNLVFVPYCDGSRHYGDRDHETEDPPRYHHGLRNLSAALDVAVASFPRPKRILLAGSSAGGYGTIYATILVRLLYPQAALFTLNDAGIGISTPDGSRAKLTNEEWNTSGLIPASCPSCKASAHSTPVIGWTLQHDPGLRVGLFSAYEDSVIADTFLMIGGAAFKQALLAETDQIVNATPERAKRFFIAGTQHTTLGDIHATLLNGVTIGQWIGFMLEADPRWTDMQAQ
jgi:hypothetical protein